jgi:hypothetical protein
MVAERTADGAELVDRLLELSRDPETSVRERLAATLALLDRLAGRPMQPSEMRALTVTATLSPLPVLEGLTYEAKLAALDAYRARALAARAIDVDPIASHLLQEAVSDHD